jgi:hypothetical protein
MLFAILAALLDTISAKPQLPVWPGNGYELFRATPLTNPLNGSRKPIYSFTYNNGQTSEDNQYLIPDQIKAQSIIDCSLPHSSNEYSTPVDYLN